MTRNRDRDRRSVLRGCGVALTGLLAGCAGGGDGDDGESDATDGDGESTPTPTEEDAEADDSGSMASFDGWMENVGNYDGVVDRTGQSEVTVKVGTEANGGAYGYGPAAVRVSAGTTVSWEWTGNGGSHNVVARDGSFESELVGEGGHTFTHTFESTGTTKYYCQPHKTMGMKGVVVVE
ncbi:MAG: halocyanin domain-containing protein [Halolamina sp.]